MLSRRPSDAGFEILTLAREMVSPNPFSNESWAQPRYMPALRGFPSALAELRSALTGVSDSEHGLLVANGLAKKYPPLMALITLARIKVSHACILMVVVVLLTSLCCFHPDSVGRSGTHTGRW